jgi:hypothetical protein
VNLSITGDPQTLTALFTEAARAMDSDGSYSFQFSDERGRELTIDVEADPSYEGLAWEQM